MGKFIDLTNRRFGRLVVIKDTGLKNRDRRHIWLCKCDCGQMVEVSSHELGSRTNSCGCLKKETISNLNKSHGLSHSRLFNIWRLMKQRCTNLNCKAYKNYGGRGIVVCDSWFNSFSNFCEWAINNGYADNLTIDRFNNDGNYEPDNCRWVNMKTQNNNRRNNHRITYKGKTQTIQMWADELGFNRSVLNDRITKLNWSIEDAMETPYLGKAGEKRWQMKRKQQEHH